MSYSFTDEEMTRLREAMDSAPSIFNQRPWDLRRVADDRVNLYSVPVGDLGRLLPREVVISCGAALYNLRLAIRVAGREPSVWLLPGLNPGSGLLTTVASGETLLASVEVMLGRPSPPSIAEQELYEALWLRRTARQPFRYVPVPPPILVEMETAAAHEHCWLRTLPDRQRRQALRAVASANEKINREKKLASATPKSGGPPIPAPRHSRGIQMTPRTSCRSRGRHPTRSPPSRPGGTCTPTWPPTRRPGTKRTTTCDPRALIGYWKQVRFHGRGGQDVVTAAGLRPPGTIEMVPGES